MASLSAWNAAEDGLLRALFAKGETFSQIARDISRECGRALSRNATIGRAHRLGLNGRKVVYTPEQRRENSKNALARNNISRKAKRAQKPIKVLRRNGGTVTEIATFEQEPFTMRLADVEPMHVALVDLAPNGCRYPYGNGPFTFCNCPKMPGMPYCQPHQILCGGASLPEHERRSRAMKRSWEHRKTLQAEVVAV